MGWETVSVSGERLNGCTIAYHNVYYNIVGKPQTVNFLLLV